MASCSAPLEELFVKSGAQDLSHDEQIVNVLWSAITNYKIIFGLSFYLLPSFIWIYLLKEIDLSLLQPIFSLVYVCTPFLAALFLNEHISVQRSLGIFIILIGVYVISRS